MIRFEELEASVGEWRARFAGAEPFPHVVIDQLCDADRLRDVAREFPDPAEMPPKPGRTGVLELSERDRLPPGLRSVSDEVLSPRFVTWLAEVSGVEGLVADPGGSWGALRQSGDGVEGKIHVAPSGHPTKPWRRCLTLILHLTDGLSEANGGCFLLWDGDKVTPQVSIAPLFNRAVVFLNAPTSFHSASRTHLGPGQTRKILQAPYFST